MLSNQQLNSAGAVAWQIIPQVSSGANEQDVTGKWLKRGLWVTWWKSSLPVLCCRWKPRPSGRLQVTQDRARDSHKALMLEASACSCPLSPVCAQTDRHGVSHSSTSFREATKQLWEQETAAGTEMWILTEGSAILWLSWPKAAAKGSSAIGGS